MDSKDILSVKDFNPLAIDITYIQETMDELPAGGQIDMHRAEELATRFLRCADYCSDFLARATRFEAQQETLVKAAKADAIERKIANGVSPTASRELFGNDQAYLKRARAHATAAAWRGWVEAKYNNLIKAHHHCKEIVRAYAQGKPSAGWDGDIQDTQYENPISTQRRGEVNWT